MSLKSINKSNDKKNKQYRFNLQDSSYYICLNITKKKNPTDPDLIFNKPNLQNEHKSERNNPRPKSRLEKVLDYNDTNIVNHQKKYQFLNSNLKDSNKKNNLSMSHEQKYHSSKSLNKTNLNLNLETSTRQNNKFKIEISPVRIYDTGSNNYEPSRPIINTKKVYSNLHTNRENYSNTKVDIDTKNDIKISKFNILPLSSRSNNPQLNRISEFQTKKNFQKLGNLTNRSIPSIIKRSQSVVDNYKPILSHRTNTPTQHRSINHKKDTLYKFQNSSIFSLEKPSYITRNSFNSDSMLSNFSDQNNKYTMETGNKRLSIFDSSGDLTEIPTRSPRRSNQKQFLVRTSTARDHYTPSNFNNLNNSNVSRCVSQNHSRVKEDMDKLFEQNRKNHQEKIINSNKVIQNKLKLQTTINKDEARFIEKSLVMENDSIKGMNSNELGCYIDNLIHEFRLKSNLVNKDLKRQLSKTNSSYQRSEKLSQIKKPLDFNFDMNDIIESIIISEGNENNDEYSMHTPNTATLPKINEESRSANTSSSDQNESSNSEKQEKETCYDSELDDSTTFINYTHSYELEDMGSDSDSGQSFEDTIGGGESAGEEEQGEFENRNKSDSDCSSSRSD